MPRRVDVDDDGEIMTEALSQSFHLGRDLRRIGKSGFGGFAPIWKQNSVEKLAVAFGKLRRRMFVVDAGNEGELGILLALCGNDCPHTIRRKVFKIVSEVVNAPRDERRLSGRKDGQFGSPFFEIQSERLGKMLCTRWRLGWRQ